VLTSDKGSKKVIYRHSGYPGGLRETLYGTALTNKPAETVRRTVKGMLPHNRLGRQMIQKLKVYAGPEHPHIAQRPQALSFEHARAKSA